MTDKAPTFTISTPEPKRSPGRPKGSTNRTSTASATTDVKQAMATLDSFYNIVATALLMTGLNQSLEEWTNSAEQLKLSNEDALKAAPKLAKWIANAGSTGGSATFILTHGMAFAGLVTTARGELAARRAEKLRSDVMSETEQSADERDFTRF